MRLRIETLLAYRLPGPTEVMARLLVANAPGQTVVSEGLQITPPNALAETTASYDGARLLRGSASYALRIAYAADVDVAPRQSIPSTARGHVWSELPAEVLRYLMPSRFCPSDKFGRFVARQFPQPMAGGARVRAILDWILTNVDYLHGVSNAETSAERTFVDRAGVCRDFTHLAITLCRAANIPARAVACYAWQLEPQDFHAVIEVYLDGGWWLADPTGLAPIDGLVRIAAGMDAADIAFLTTDQMVDLAEMCVSVAAL